MTVSLDLMGPYPRSATGKLHLLVVTDIFSKWVEAFPIAKATSRKIIQVLQNEVFARWGYAKFILSDNAAQFHSKAWTLACKRWGTEAWYTPVYHAQANPTERRNQEFKKLIRITVDTHHSAWDTCIPDILFNLRDRRNEATRFSPAELMFGQPMRRPGDWAGVRRQEMQSSLLDQLRGKQQRLSNMQEQAASNQQQYQDKYKKEPGNITIQPGSMVMVATHYLSNAEEKFHAGFAPKAKGPFQVVEQVSSTVFYVDTGLKKPTMIHINDLHIVQQRPDNLVPVCKPGTYTTQQCEGEEPNSQNITPPTLMSPPIVEEAAEATDDNSETDETPAPPSPRRLRKRDPAATARYLSKRNLED